MSLGLTCLTCGCGATQAVPLKNTALPPLNSFQLAVLKSVLLFKLCGFLLFFFNQDIFSFLKLLGFEIIPTE